MTNYKLNTRIEWTEEDRKRGECPVPEGSDVTVWLYEKSSKSAKFWGKMKREKPNETLTDSIPNTGSILGVCL